MLGGAFPTPEDHDASYSTATSCSSISATLVSLLAWKRSLCLFPRVSPRVACSLCLGCHDTTSIGARPFSSVSTTNPALLVSYSVGAQASGSLFHLPRPHPLGWLEPEELSPTLGVEGSLDHADVEGGVFEDRRHFLSLVSPSTDLHS